MEKDKPSMLSEVSRRFPGCNLEAGAGESEVPRNLSARRFAVRPLLAEKETAVSQPDTRHPLYLINLVYLSEKFTKKWWADCNR